MTRRLSQVVSTALFVVAVLAGCTDLGAVREWSSTSMQAAQFNEIVTTYKDTPQRLSFYDRDGEDLWKAQTKIREAQAKALTLQLSLVADYMAALAALSADSVTDYSGDIDQLADSLNGTGQVSEATVGAVGKLVTTLLNAAAKAWQQEKVGELVEQGNSPLQELLKNELRSIVDGDFRRDLQIEAGLLDRYFEDLIRTAGGSASANAALEEWFILRKAQNERRFAAVDAYVEVLDKISEGHQKLFDNRNDLDAVQLAKDLYKLAKEIRDNIKDIVKA